MVLGNYQDPHAVQKACEIVIPIRVLCNAVNNLNHCLGRTVR